MKNNSFTTAKTETSTHIIYDGGCLYWISAPGKTNDEIADMFRAGYDGDLSDGGFDVTTISTDEETKYSA